MKISVIIPAYNEEQTIGDCVKSVIEQDYDNKEVIVVNNLSTDKTKEVANSFKGVKVVDCKTRGVSNARNFGAKKAKGKVLFFLDADEFLQKNALKNTVKLFKEFNPDAIAYQRSVIKPKSWRRIWVYKFLAGWCQHKSNVFNLDTKDCPYIIKKNKLKEIGGFLQGAYFFQDKIMLDKMKSHGLRILETPEVETKSDMGVTFNDFKRRAKRIGSVIKESRLWFMNLKNLLLAGGLGLSFFYPIIYLLFYVIYGFNWGFKTRDWLIGLTSPFLFTIKRFLIVYYMIKELI